MQEQILDHPWNTWILKIWESENLKMFGCLVYKTSRFVFVFFLLLTTVFFSFFVFFWFQNMLFWCNYDKSETRNLLWFYDMIIWWNHEKAKMRNFLRFILPAEFLEKLGYEFHQKTWIHFSKKWTNFSIFGQRNPYHQSTHRFLPLHPIFLCCWFKELPPTPPQPKKTIFISERF